MLGRPVPNKLSINAEQCVGTISAKEILGTLRGKIKKLPTDIGPEGPQDGIIEYEKDGSMQEVRFGAQDVNEYLSTLDVNDQVCGLMLASYITTTLARLRACPYSAVLLRESLHDSGLKFPTCSKFVLESHLSRFLGCVHDFTLRAWIAGQL